MGSPDNYTEAKSQVKDDDEKKKSTADEKLGNKNEAAKPDEPSGGEENKNTEEKKGAEDKTDDAEQPKEKSNAEGSKRKSKSDGSKSNKGEETTAKDKSNKSATNKSAIKSKSKSKSDVKQSSSVENPEEKSKLASPQESDSSLCNSSGSNISKKSKKASDHPLRVGFFGAGRMADSIVRGLIKVDKCKPKTLYVAAKSGRNLEGFKSNGVKTTQRTYDLFGKYRCDVVFLCVHGIVVRNCFKMGGTRPFPLTTNYVPSRKSKYYVLSLIGGIPMSDVKIVLMNPETHQHSTATFHRISMNASCAYGIGLGAIDVEYDSKKCSPVVRDLISSIAKIITIDEGSMDAACAVGGNGLAIIYYFIAAMSDGGFKMGLSKNVANKLAAKVMSVAAMAVLESNQNLADLRDACCSPSGAAIYGLAVLEKHDLASGIQCAVEAAYRRLKQLCEVDVNSQ